MELLKSNLGRLRIVAFLEGLSFILLVCIGMPLKYYGGYTHATQELGMAHGFLFILYLILAVPVLIQYKWSIITSMLVLLASLFPLGTFIAEYKLFSRQE